MTAMTGNRSASLLTVTDLDVTFAGGGQAVRGVSFTLTPGETLAVVGESGAGKTATALAVMGLLPETATVAGSVRFRGRELLGLADKDLAPIRGDDLALVPQDTTLTPVYRVGDQIAEAIRAHTRVPRRAASERAVRLLAGLGIPDAPRVARAFPHQLSGGQLRRVMVAIAVAAGPAVILADEPTAALDPLARSRVLDTLGAARVRTGAALVLITHDLAAAADRADRVLVLHDGRVLDHGPAGDVLRTSRARHSDADTAVPIPARSATVRTYGRPCDADPPALEVRGLVKDHPPRDGRLVRRRAGAVRAVDAIDLDVRAGETVGLVGESGCGKTTTLLEILRLGTPQAGRITVFGHDTASLSGAERRTLRQDLQIVFQDPLAALDPRMTVGASLSEALRAHARRERPARVHESLRLVGLPPAYASRRPGELSGGQRRRVCLARALACEPRLLLLDEPFSALDVTAQADLITLLRDLRARLGLAYLIAAHDLTALGRLADRVAIMSHGRIVEVGDPAAISTNPAHPRTRALLHPPPGRYDPPFRRPGTPRDTPPPSRPPDPTRPPDPSRPPDLSRPPDSARPPEPARPPDSVRPCDQVHPPGSVRESEPGPPSDRMPPSDPVRSVDCVGQARPGGPIGWVGPTGPSGIIAPAGPAGPAGSRGPADPGGLGSLGGCRFRDHCPVFAALAAHDRRRCADEDPVPRHVRPGQAVACHFPAHTTRSPR